MIGRAFWRATAWCWLATLCIAGFTRWLALRAKRALTTERVRGS
ncbi:MAG: hypothetical protein AB7F35_06485 [Acetobacteraceae bacterium]